ncbi:MAG: cytochrome c family protein [Proteobacteria bacterium]|nr:cytochrome c family protein [Pseudomonadota bacterium]MBU1708666.1 cytochrome c family protein [Pseudomonadota bacterium]
MNKRTSIIAVAISLLLLISGLAVSGEELQKTPVYPEGELTLEGKKSARFGHEIHEKTGIQCAQCHHDKAHKGRTQEEIAAMEDTSQLQCLACHNQLFENENLKVRKAIFHAKCKECHKNGFEGKNGPVNCKGCHVAADGAENSK